MCESTAYLVVEGKEQVLLKDVTNIAPEADGWLLTSLFGERRKVSYRLKQVDLMEHRILFSQA